MKESKVSFPSISTLLCDGLLDTLMEKVVYALNFLIINFVVGRMCGARLSAASFIVHRNSNNNRARQ